MLPEPVAAELYRLALDHSVIAPLASHVPMTSKTIGLPDEGSSPLTSVWYWLRWTGATVACAWIGVEASIQYRMAGRREALGLSDALVRNRLLLWGGVGVCWVVLQIVYIGQDIAWARTQQWPAFSDTLVGIIEFLSIGMVWIAFFPPRAYRAWIERRTPDAARAEG